MRIDVYLSEIEYVYKRLKSDGERKEVSVEDVNSQKTP
jgi:hypothetical protein